MGFGAGSRGALIAVLPLVAGGLVTLSGAVSGSAEASCAPSLITASQHASAAKKPTIKAAKPTIRKIKKHVYAAKIVLTVTQGSATVAVTQSVCPDGAAGAAATTTQTASAAGVTTKAVSAKGTSKRAATKAAKAKAKKLKATLQKKGATKKGRKRAKKRATAAARPLAVSKAHDALYLSDVAYLTADSSGTYHVTAAPSAAAPTLAPAADGDIVMTVPAGYSATNLVDLPCLRRAPAWPTSYLFDGGDIVSPDLQAIRNSQGGSAEVDGLMWAAASGLNQSAEWYPLVTDPTTVTYGSGLQDSATAMAAELVCFVPRPPQSPESRAYVVRIHGAHVGTTLSAADPTSGLAHVVGGVPVAVR
jgi:hypothetical protein